eukprot:Hpha_TRINITY_DN15987_c2_g3::TRINITY_DN15987_c2_g3_i1::g.72304::m.72304
MGSSLDCRQRPSLLENATGQPTSSMILSTPAAERINRGPRVAVVTLKGSLCPISRGHVQMFEESRRVLEAEGVHGRPYDYVLGYILLNGDHRVGPKMAEAGSVHLNKEERRELVGIATSKLDWLGYSDLDWEGRKCPEKAVAEEVRRFLAPSGSTVDHYYLNGADDVVKYRKWEWTGPFNRFITMCRPGYTETLLLEMRKQGVIPSPYFLIGPELPDISSTEARAALKRGDLATATKLLDEGVVAWLMKNVYKVFPDKAKHSGDVPQEDPEEGGDAADQPSATVCDSALPVSRRCRA